MTQDDLRAALLLMGFSIVKNRPKAMTYYSQNTVFKVRFHTRSNKVNVIQLMYFSKWRSVTHSPKEAFNYIKEKLS